MSSKLKALFFLFLIVTAFISSAYLFLPQKFQSLDNRIRDFYFTVRGPQKTDENIVIVDIDEKSIKALGQWPWERDTFAQILKNLSLDGAGIIGLDIVFSEADKTSPKQFAKRWHLPSQNLPDTDQILADTIAKTPTILGYVFDFTEHNNNEAPQIPAIFIQKHKKKREFLPQAKGVLANLPIIQNAAYSSGYMNNIPDPTGMIRSVPLLIKYDDALYPSLAFEMYRIASNAQKVTLHYSPAGIESIELSKQKISPDRFGRLHVNFRGPFKSYKYISAVNVYTNHINPKDIAGKFILIGTSAYGLMDLRSTPMDSVIAGVEVHANVIDNLLHNDLLKEPSWEESVNLSIIILLALFIFFFLSRLSLILLSLTFLTTLLLLLYGNYYLLFTQHLILNIFFPLTTMVLSLIGVLGVNFMYEFSQKELVKKSFSKKVSKQVMNDLLSHVENTDLSAKELETTIYFSDIRSFTTISETLKSPRRITEFLNFFMNAMVISIEKYQGTIDKFIGDAIMAYWNAPLPVKNHADKAVQTALEQIAKRETLNRTIHEKFGFSIDYGIGINTGNVVVGEIGSSGRSDYTIIGDAVNLASRLEGLCKPYKVRLVISEFTKEQLTQEYVIQMLDMVQVKGKHEPVKIYEVLTQGTAAAAKKQELQEYEKAHQTYINADFSLAKELFAILHQKYEKYLYKLYKERCEHLEVENIQEFNGVFTFTTK